MKLHAHPEPSLLLAVLAVASFTMLVLAGWAAYHFLEARLAPLEAL